MIGIFKNYYKMQYINPYRYQQTSSALQITINTALGDADNTFYVATNSSLTYSCTIDWGDESTSEITSYDDADLDHTYSSGGTYTISITGTFESFYFNNSGDYLKVTGILSFGNVGYTMTGSDFYGCSNISTTLPEIPSSVTSIGTATFRGCSGLTGSLTIPSSVTSIDSRAFQSCSGFTGNLIISSNVTSIGFNAFLSCSGFTGSLTIPSSVTSIGTYAFFNCSSFNGVLTIPSSITSISDYTFYGCSALTEVDCYPLTAPTVGTGGITLGGTARELHIQSSGTSGYDVSPWTDTGTFSSIVEDL